MSLPNSRIVVGEQYNRDQYNPAHFACGVEIPQEDCIKLRVHMSFMEEISNFEATLANFDKKYIETYPIKTKDFVRIWIGRGTVKPQIFQGRVEEIDAESEATENYLIIKGRCIGEDLYRRLVTELWRNQKGESIVSDLLNKYCTFLRYHRNGTSLIETTDTTYTELEYDKAKLKDVLDFIAKTADKAGVIGFDHRIEYDGLFAFFPRGTKTSPISLTDVIKRSDYRRTVHRVRNRIFIYGAAEKGAPYDKDAWTESLTPTDGAWSSGTGTGSVSLDGSIKAKGSYSIKHTTETSDEQGIAVFTLASGKEVNMDLYPTINFLTLIDSGPSGQIVLVLWDENSFTAAKAFRISYNEEWKWNEQKFQGGRKNADGWEVAANFDWTKIKKVLFYYYFTGTGTGAFWIDNLFFGGARYGVSSPHEGCTVAIPQENITNPADVREMVEVNEELLSDAECVLRAKAYLGWLKDEAEFLTLETEILDFGSDRIQPGDMQLVVLPNENVNKSFRVLSVDYKLGEDQELPITIELGKETPLLADYIYRLRKETGTMARLKSGVIQ